MANFVDELQHLQNETGSDYFIFNDDNFMTKGNHNRRRAQELTEELKKRNMKIRFELMARADSIDRQVLKTLKYAGLQRVFLGIESFDQAHLDRFNKQTTVRQNLKAIIMLKKLKIDTIVSVILTDAQTGLFDLVKQFVFLYWIRKRFFNSDDSKISVNEKLEINRGSPLYDQYKSKKLLTRDDWLDGYDYRLKLLTALRLKLIGAEKHTVKLIIDIKTALKKLFRSEVRSINQDPIKDIV
jgi:histone acetyltransferase (RNA polymerase elongator complex component)